MHLTRRGASVAGAAVALLFGGRLLGLLELYVISVCALALLGVAFVWTRTRVVRVRVQRSIPERLQVGTDGRVDILAVNDHADQSPTLECDDVLDGGRRTARLLLPPLDPGESARAAYRVPTERRGRFTLGPLTLTATDPFGLTARRFDATGREEFLVHPRVHDVLALPELGGHGLDTDAREVRGRIDINGEFHTLRDYLPSDDLRRVHWKATARRGELMVRQDESRHRAPVVVVLDVRRRAHDAASFERAVEACASIVTVLVRQQRPVELWTTDGRRLGTRGQRYLATVFDELAVVEADGPDRIVLPANSLRARTVVVVAAVFGQQEIGALAPLVRRTGTLAVVACRGSADGIAGRAPAVRILTCAAPPDVDFTSAWNQAVLAWRHVDNTSILRS